VLSVGEVGKEGGGGGRRRPRQQPWRVRCETRPFTPGSGGIKERYALDARENCEDLGQMLMETEVAPQIGTGPKQKCIA
jgi:hypothetical protein